MNAFNPFRLQERDGRMTCKELWIFWINAAVIMTFRLYTDAGNVKYLINVYQELFRCFLDR